MPYQTAQGALHFTPLIKPLSYVLITYLNYEMSIINYLELILLQLIY